MSDLLHLDICRLLLAHAGLGLVSSLSNAPVWNLPLALYGLVIAGKEDGGDGGESIRQFSALFGLSFLLDVLWLMGGNEPSALAWFLIVANFLLKPVTLLSALGHLRERGHATFDLPGGFSLPGGNNGGSGGFPPQQQRPNETLWSAPPQQSSYHQSSESFESPRPTQARASAPPAAPAAPAYQAPSHGAEGGGYHTLQ